MIQFAVYSLVLGIRGVDDTQGGDGALGILRILSIHSHLRQTGCNNGVGALLTAADGVGVARGQDGVEAAWVEPTKISAMQLLFLS